MVYQADRITRSVALLGVLVVALVQFCVVATADSEELLRGKERCLRHDDFPSPGECCTKPQWINRYTALRRCQFVHTKVDEGRYERGSCAAKCGLYKLNVTMTDRIGRVRIFRPRLQTRGLDASWAQVIVEALRTCKPRLTALEGRHVRTDEEMEQCEIAEDIFRDCVHGQMFMHCPRHAWISSGVCDIMREQLAAGCPYKSLGDVITLDDEGHVRDDQTAYGDDDDYRGGGGGGDRTYPDRRQTGAEDYGYQGDATDGGYAV